MKIQKLINGANGNKLAPTLIAGYYKASGANLRASNGHKFPFVIEKHAKTAQDESQDTAIGQGESLH